MAHNTIRHPDLSKMTDRHLSNELMYLYHHASEISIAMNERITDLVAMAYHLSYKPQTIPLWKLHEDYQACTDRMQAIVEEMKYREIP